SIADAWLGEEILRPSIASGVSKISVSHPGMTWLVEGKHATTVEHFTFTLNHQNRRHDLCAQTIHAFAHFVYGNSNRNIVLADIQGTPAHIDGQDTMVLFDPMTHTPNGDSGIGDFGVSGIKSFIRDHVCGDVCRSLSL
ncbi:kinase-like domain-containing protein, partial [Mycena filopes]